VFVSVLGASGYLYAEATRSQDLASWLGAHVRALEFYRAAPRVIVPDNLKSGVTKACWYDPELNPSYLELARTYSVAVLPTRPAHPRDRLRRRLASWWLNAGCWLRCASDASFRSTN
jgi:transposase